MQQQQQNPDSQSPAPAPLDLDTYKNTLLMFNHAKKLPPFSAPKGV
jgi:hypothetical protein